MASTVKFTVTGMVAAMILFLRGQPFLAYVPYFGKIKGGL
jgi:hypothetical protein